MTSATLENPVSDLRRELIAVARRHHATLAANLAASNPTEAELLVAAASGEAATYAYAVAAILGRITDSQGVELGDEMAIFVARLLETGDDDPASPDRG